jgi:aminopeptidase N
MVRTALSLLAVAVLASACSFGSGTPTSTTAGAVGVSTSDPDTLPDGTIARPGVHADDGLGDPLYPDLGNAGYDVQHADVAIRFDTSSGRLEGQTVMEILALEDLDSWSVDLDVLFPSEVLVDGEPAVWSHENGELRIDPARVVVAGETFVLSITYGGLTEPHDSPAATFMMGIQRSVDGFFAISEPDGTSSWMPVNDHPRDKATYALAISVPGPLVVAASGMLVGVEQADDGFIKYVFEVADPIAPYLLAFGVGDFKLVEQEGSDGVAIRNYFDVDIRDSTLAIFDKQAEMIAFLADRFGPYPFDTYGALVLDTTEVGVALETQTLSTFGAQVLSIGEDVVIHELAHQWFGDSVSLQRWDDIWLNEGHATYAQWLWVEETQGPEFRDVRIAQAYDLMSGRQFLNGTDSESVAAAQAYRQFPPPGEPKADDIFNASVYLRGGLTLHALRLEIGDEAFFEVATTFQKRFAYGNATTADFIATVNEVTGQNLTRFLEAWLYDEAMPPLPSLGLAPLNG